MRFMNPPMSGSSMIRSFARECLRTRGSYIDTATKLVWPRPRLASGGQAASPRPAFRHKSLKRHVCESGARRSRQTQAEHVIKLSRLDSTLFDLSPLRWQTCARETQASYQPTTIKD